MCCFIHSYGVRRRHRHFAFHVFSLRHGFSTSLRLCSTPTPEPPESISPSSHPPPPSLPLSQATMSHHGASVAAALGWPLRRLVKRHRVVIASSSRRRFWSSHQPPAPSGISWRVTWPHGMSQSPTMSPSGRQSPIKVKVPHRVTRYIIPVSQSETKHPTAFPSVLGASPSILRAFPSVLGASPSVLEAFPSVPSVPERASHSVSWRPIVLNVSQHPTTTHSAPYYPTVLLSVLERPTTSSSVSQPLTSYNIAN